MHFGRVGMLSRPCGVSVFDDYALPANYGEPEPPAQQKAPERPRMRVVPNANEMPTPTHVEAYGSLGVPRMSGYGAEAVYPVSLPMRKGRSSADDVRVLQGILRSKRYDLGTTGGGTGIDGDWGDKTSAAVKAEQYRYGLPIDGNTVDQTLWDRMTNRVATVESAPAPAPTTAVDVATSGVLGLLQGLTGQTQPGTTFQPSAASDTSSVSTNGGSQDDTNTQTGTNWMPWVLAGVGVLAIGGLIYVVTRKSEKDEE